MLDSPYFDDVCDRLDTRCERCGNYYDVAKSCGIQHHTIKARFEKHDEGPSAALFEYLSATKPKMTVEEFILILERERVHERVILTLEAFDSHW